VGWVSGEKDFFGVGARDDDSGGGQEAWIKPCLVRGLITAVLEATTPGAKGGPEAEAAATTPVPSLATPIPAVTTPVPGATTPVYGAGTPLCAWTTPMTTPASCSVCGPAAVPFGGVLGRLEPVGGNLGGLICGLEPVGGVLWWRERLGGVGGEWIWGFGATNPAWEKKPCFFSPAGS
jgi:hypothetical protein